MDGRAAGSDASAKPHDGVAMHAGQSLDGANAETFTQGANDGDLLFKREGGGFARLDKLFNGQLQPVLEAFNDALWADNQKSA